MRKAPSVASSWLSWISTLMTWTGCRVSCSLELKSGDQQQTRQCTTQLEAVKHSPQSYHFGIEMWNSSIKAAFIQESSEQPSLSFPSAQRYILMRPHPPALGHRPSPHRWWPGRTCPCSFESALVLIWCACCGPACARCRSVCIWRVGRSRIKAAVMETSQRKSKCLSPQKAGFKQKTIRGGAPNKPV